MKKVVIIGGGFAGIRVAQGLNSSKYSVTIIDKNNYHQFQPLLYQVAISGLEPGSICFPYRGLVGRNSWINFIMAEVIQVDTEHRHVVTDDSQVIEYDYLVVSSGSQPNFYGNDNIKEHALTLKNIKDAVMIKDRLLSLLEAASQCKDPEHRQAKMTVVVVGGGPTGVEVAGALADMNKYVVEKDFDELGGDRVKIILVEGKDKLLSTMSDRSSKYALRSLRDMGVSVKLGMRVVDYDGMKVVLSDGTIIPTYTVVWVSGVMCQPIKGLPLDSIDKVSGRIIVDNYLRIESMNDVYAIGDISNMRGLDGILMHHPQVAPVAMQQADNVVHNLNALANLEDMRLESFVYNDPGSMATIGRKRAVVDIGTRHLEGSLAWLMWMGVHLRYLSGDRNRIMVLIEWMWYYFNYKSYSGMIMNRSRFADFHVFMNNDKKK